MSFLNFIQLLLCCSQYTLFKYFQQQKDQFDSQLRAEIQTFYDEYITPHQPDPLNPHVQQNYEIVMKRLQQEYISILKYSTKAFKENDIQNMRQFVLDKIADDSKKVHQPINAELIEALNIIIQEDNNKNCLLGIKALMNMITCQYEKLVKQNQRFDISPYNMILQKDVLKNIDQIVQSFISQKMSNFQKLQNVFQPQKDKQQWAHYLLEKNQQKQQGGQQQQPEVLLIENKYDLKTYEDMTATVSTIILFLGQAQKSEQVQRQQDILQSIKEMIDSVKKYLKLSVDAISNTNFEYTQQEFNRKFHEDLGSIHRKMLSFILLIYKGISLIDQQCNSQQMITELQKAALSYTYRFPDEYLETKIFLYKEYSKILLSQQQYQEQDLNRFSMNPHDIFQIDKIVSLYNKNDIYGIYLKIVKGIFLSDQVMPPQNQNQNQRPQIKNHQSSKIQSIPERAVYMHVEKIIDNLTTIIYDNSISMSILQQAIDTLIYIVIKYFGQDQEYFKRPHPITPEIILTKKIRIIEELLKFIGNKYKDLNIVLQSIASFLKKQFTKSQQPQKKALPPNQQPPQHPQLQQNPNIQPGQQQAQQQQQLQQPIIRPNINPQGSTPNPQLTQLNNPSNPNNPNMINQQLLNQQKAKNVKIEQKPNPNQKQPPNQAIPQAVPKPQQNKEEDEATFKSKYADWIQKKRNYVGLNAYPKMQRVKRKDESELQKIQKEILENEDFYSFQQYDNTKQFTKEDIQAEFEGDHLSYLGVEIKRENLFFYFHEMLNLFKNMSIMQGKFQGLLLQLNSEHKKQIQQNEHTKQIIERFNLNQDQIGILRKIFKNGIEVFSNFHNMFHVEIRFTDSNFIRRFIFNFASIEHECHFKDIIEPNFKYILKMLIKTSIDSDKCQCFKYMTELGFYKDAQNPNAQPSYFITINFFNHILLKNLFLIIDQQNETLDPFNEFFALYKNKFFDIIQSLIDRVFTGIIAQYDNDSYKQIIKKSILFLFKKIHTSPYPLEYMKILKWFALQLNDQSTKNVQKENSIRTEILSIYQNQDKLQDSINIEKINSDINQIEDALIKEQSEVARNTLKERLRKLKEESKNYEGINILDNYMQLLELNCSKFQIQIAKIYLCLTPFQSQSTDLFRKKQVAKILMICMSLSERNMAKTALNQLDMITQKLQREEVEIVLDDIKDELIDRLYQIASEYRPIDTTQKEKELQKQSVQDNSKIAFKLLSKISFLTKQHKIHCFITENEQAPQQSEKIYLEFDIFNNKNGGEEKKSLKLDVKQTVEHSINLFNILINNFFNQPIKHNVIEMSFAMIKYCIVKYFCRSDDLSIEWLYENENGVQIQEQQQQKNKPQQHPGIDIMAEEFEIKKKISREFMFENASQFEAEKELNEKVNSLFGSGSNPNGNSQNLLIMKLLKVLMDLISIDQKSERDQGLLLKIRKESERILSVISRVLSQSLVDLLINQHNKNPASVQQYFKNLFSNKNSPYSVFITTLICQLKNQNFMERKTNPKVLPCSEKIFLWNEIFMKNIHKFLLNDGTKSILYYFQSGGQSLSEPSPKQIPIENESQRVNLSIDAMIGELENFVLTTITKEISNSHDSFKQQTSSRELFFPSTISPNTSGFPNHGMGSSIISSHNFESQSESRMFDNNNNSLNKKFCLVECLNEVMNIFKPKVIGLHISNILDSAFIISNNLPEIVNLQSMQDFCQQLIKKILQYIKKQKDQYSLNSMLLRKVLTTFVNNLTTCKPLSHLYARNALTSISKIHNTNILSILYLSSTGKMTEDIKFCDQFDQLINQAKKEDELADYLATPQQQEQMPSKYDFITLMKNHPTLYISQLLMIINSVISLFQTDYSMNSFQYYSQNSLINRRILQYLFMCENCIPFKLIDIKKSELSLQFEYQVNYFLSMSQKIIEKNNKELKASRIILQNTTEHPQNPQGQQHPNQGPIHPSPQAVQQPTPHLANQPNDPNRNSQYYQNQQQQQGQQGQQHMLPQGPSGQPGHNQIQHGSHINQIPARQMSMNESGFSTGSQPPNPNMPNQRNQSGQIMPPPNQPPMNPQNPGNRMINQYPQQNNPPNAPQPMNGPSNQQPSQQQANRQNQPYPPNSNAPLPPNSSYPPNPPNYYGNQSMNQPRPALPNVPQGRGPNFPAGQQPSQSNQSKNQNAYINQCQLFYEDELGLNIEDLNFNLKNWAKLISSLAVFLKSITLSCPTKYLIRCIEREERKIIDQQAQMPPDQNRQNFIRLTNEQRNKAIETVEDIKYQNLNRLYDLMPRIEKTIHSTAQECIIEINKKNGSNNKMALEEDKLKSILRPVLFCLQSSFKRFTPQFLLIFKKILKMLVNCFNVKLITLLINNLDTIIKETNNTMNEQSFSDYKIKNISGLLSLFQHLKNSLYQHIKGTKEAVSSKDQIKLIINKTLKIQENYSVRYGWHYVEQKTLKPISKLMNVQTDFITEILIKDKRIPQQNQMQNQQHPPIPNVQSDHFSDQALEFLYKILKQDMSFELRESITRDFGEIDFFVRLWDPNRPLLLQLKIIYLLAKKSSRVFTKAKIEGIRFLIDECKKFTVREPLNLQNIKCYVLFMKLFILYFKRMKDTNILYCIINHYSDRHPTTQFLKRFFEEQVPALLNIEQKRKFLQTTLISMTGDKFDLNQIRVYLKLIIKPIVQSLGKIQIIQINNLPIPQKQQQRQSFTDFLIDIQKKFEEKFKKFQQDRQHLPNLNQQLQTHTQNQDKQSLSNTQKEIQRIHRNNDRFSKELVQVEICRLIFIFGKELKMDLLKKLFFQLISVNLEQSENPTIKQLYYSIQIKIMKLTNMTTDFNLRKQLFNNIFKGYYSFDQELYKTQSYFVQQLVVNNINYFIKYITNQKNQILELRQQQPQVGGVNLQLQQNQNQQQNMQNQQQYQQNQQNQQLNANQQPQQAPFQMNQAGQNQMNPIQGNQGQPNIPYGGGLQENKQTYYMIKDFLTQDKDKIILNSVITYNENFFELNEIVALDFFSEMNESFKIQETKINQQKEIIIEFFNKLEDDGRLSSLFEQRNPQEQQEYFTSSQFIYNLINTYVSWKFKEMKDEQQKPNSNQQLQQKKSPQFIEQEKMFGEKAINFLIFYILDQIQYDERVVELFYILLKKCLIIWNDSKVYYKMIKYKYILNMLKIDNEVQVPGMQMAHYLQNQKTQTNRYYLQILNILNICLECSFDIDCNFGMKDIFKILNWSTLLQINKNKSRNRSTTSASQTNGQIEGQNTNQGPQSANKKATIKEKKDHQSIMNINENDQYFIIMTANIIYSLLDICEEDTNAKQSIHFNQQLFAQLKQNIEGHHFQIDGQDKQISDSEPLTISIDLMLDKREDLSSIRLNQILKILESQNKQHKQRDDDRIEKMDKLYYENFFCPKYAHYIPYNSSLYFETSKVNSFNLLTKYSEEKIEVDPQSQADDYQTEITQQQQNKRNKQNSVIKREGGFETTQSDIDKALKYCNNLFREHQEFFEFPLIRYQPKKYSYAQNLSGLMYICLCVITLIKENKTDTILQYIKRVLKVLFNIIDEGGIYALRIEALNLLRIFFLGKENFPNNQTPQKYNLIEKVIHIIPSITKDEIAKWIFVYNDIEKKFRKFPRGFYYSTQEEIGYVNITRIAEENIQFSFFKFLVDILKMTDSTLKSISPIELRKYLLLFSKPAASPYLDYFFNTVEQNENLNELNTLFLLLGQSKYEEKLNEKNINREMTDELQTHLLKDEGEINYYENDDVFLLSFKYLLFKIKKISQGSRVVFENFFNFPKMTIQANANQQKKTVKNALYEDIQELLEEISEFDQSRQTQWVLECVQDMMQSCSRKTTIANDFKSLEMTDEFRYIVLSQQYVSKFHPINVQLLQPQFLNMMKFFIDSCQTRAMKVLLYQSIEEYLIYFTSQSFNTYANKAYSIPSCSSNEERRISKNWAYALFQVFFFEFDANIPYILNANRVYQIIRTHHCWDIGLIYFEKVIDLMNQGKCEQDIQVYERIQQIYFDLGESDQMYGVINQLVKNDNLIQALCLSQQREFQQTQQTLIRNIDKLNENDQSFGSLYSSFTQDYETLYFISTYRQLFLETQKNLNEWDSLITLSKSEQNDHLLSESSYYSLNTNIKDVQRILEKDLQIIKEIKEKEKQENQNIFFQPSFMYHHVSILQMFSNRSKSIQINEGLQKANIQLAYEWAQLPKTITQSHYNLITQQQAITELEEANIVFGKLRSDEEKYYQYAFGSFAQMIQQWRERLPHKYDSLSNWKMLVNQREYIYGVFFDFIKEKFNIQDRSSQAISNSQNQQMPQTAKDIIFQYIDSDWNNYQYFKNYGITNQKLLPPKRLEYFSIEDQYLRIKCLMKNQLLDSSQSSDENYQETNKIFIDTLQKQRRNYETFKPYFEQLHLDITLKESQILFKKNKYFETIQRMKDLLSKPYQISKTCFTYLEICFNILRSEKSHKDYFNRMILIIMSEALKYKPYYSRLYLILFFASDFMTSSPDQIKQFKENNYRPMHHALILWLPKILYMYQKYKSQENQQMYQLFEKLIDPLKYYEQYLLLTFRSYLPNQQPSQFVETYKNLKNYHTCKKIESAIKTIYSFISDPQNTILIQLGYKYQESNNILEQIQSVTSLNEYQEVLNQRIIPQIKNICQPFSYPSQSFNNEINIELIQRLANSEKQINPEISPSQLIEIVRTQIIDPLIQLYHKNKQNFICEYSISTLLAFQLDASDVEIPGQYTCNNPRVFKEFQPKTHIYMSSLEKEIEIQLGYRKLSKKILINASNCKQYAYEIDQEQQQIYSFGQKNNSQSFEQNAHKMLEIGMLQQCLNSQFFKQRETFSRNLKICQNVRIPLFKDSQTTTTVMKSTSRTLYTMQNVHDWYLTHYCKQHDPTHKLDPFNMHLNYFDLSNPKNANQKMREIIQQEALSQFIQSKYFRKEFSYNYASASFFNYLIGQNISLSDISFDYNSGEVFIESRNIGMKNDKVIFKNFNSVRLSPSISKFIGQIGISGILCSSFISMAKSITTKELPIILVVQLVFEDLLQLNNIPEDQFKGITDKTIQKILWLYCQDYTTNNYSRNEICTRIYNIFDIIQENQNNVYNQTYYKYWF